MMAWMHSFAPIVISRMHRTLRVALLLGASLILAGCVTSKKYKMVPTEGARPPQVLGWQVNTAGADLTLQSVIVFRGPGSWKREARWDEYVVTMANHGAAPLVVEWA